MEVYYVLSYINKIEDVGKLRNLKPSTIRTYKNNVVQFLDFIQKNPEELTADNKHLGAKVGYICVLHTWGSEMNYHPHIHVILLGGGLSAKNEWRDKGEEFFLPVKDLSKVFCGKYMNELKSLYKDNKLVFHGSSEKYRNSYNFKELLNTCCEKDWVPHCKKTFNGAQSVIISYACSTKAFCPNQTLRLAVYP